MIKELIKEYFVCIVCAICFMLFLGSAFCYLFISLNRGFDVDNMIWEARNSSTKEIENLRNSIMPSAFKGRK